MSRETTCCFTGHRPEKLPWGENERDPRCAALKRWLDGQVVECCRLGVDHFLCGMARGADFYFCETVLKVKEIWPGVRLEAAVPCQTQTEGWTAADRDRYHRLLAGCDLVTLVQEAYTPGCMMRRNRYMVERSARIIAVYDGYPGGTRNTLAYAMRRGLEVRALDPGTLAGF